MTPTAIVVGKRSRREVPLVGAVTVVGRDAGAGLELGDLQVSRRHALLVRCPRGTFIKDLGSRNGVLLNDRRVPSRGQSPLKNGDVLALGRTTIIYRESSPDDAAPAAATRIATPIAAPATRPQPTRTGPSPEALAAVAAVVPISDAVVPRAAPPAGAQATDEDAPPAPAHAIPRALAPTSYAGPAEALALRALYDRAERDRVHYRNLALILFGLWTATLILLALAVFGDWGRRTDRAPANPPPLAAAPQPATPETPTPVPLVEIHGAAQAQVGQDVVLSADAPLEGATIRWTLIDRPVGSAAEVFLGADGRALLRPDRPGPYTLAVVANDGQVSTSATATIHALPDADAPAGPRWLDVAGALLGRELAPDELAALDQAEPAARVDALLAEDALYASWWGAELEHLGLTGPHQPVGRPWDGLPGRLQSGETAATEALSMLLLSRAWSARHPTADAYVEGALSGLLGKALAGEPSLAEAARRLYDGHTTTFLGVEVSDHLGLVHALTTSPEAATELLRRAATRTRGVAPDPDALAIAAEQLHADPRAFFRLMVELSLTRL